MITITTAAATQIKVAMLQSDSEGMSLRIAARRLEDGSFDYAMGFDETDHNDSHARSNGVEVVVAPTSTEMLVGATLDFVEIEGEQQFIFINPNDPSHIPSGDDGENKSAGRRAGESSADVQSDTPIQVSQHRSREED